jgi:16S rRNA (cytosine1402-N4)-methyltransferase
VLHKTVLKEEAVAALSVQPNGFYIDATFGRGGHTEAILKELGPEGSLLALDRDPEAVAAARRLSELDKRLVVEHGTFAEIDVLAERYGVLGKVSGILFDLGVSSPQLDDPGRGFSFLRDGPLDMRMDTESTMNAADWLNAAPAGEIAEVLKKFGEERHAKRLANAIVREREEEPISNTGRLAEIIKTAHPAWEKDKHPATKSFQAIRIFVNSELIQIEKGLQCSEAVLAAGGRLAVISFHSLEDRIVKRFIAEKARGDNFPRDLPIPADKLTPSLKKLGKAIKPGDVEISANPRARSAVMRVAEKLTPLNSRAS